MPFICASEFKISCDRKVHVVNNCQLMWPEMRTPNHNLPILRLDLQFWNFFASSRKATCLFRRTWRVFPSHSPLTSGKRSLIMYFSRTGERRPHDSWIWRAEHGVWSLREVPSLMHSLSQPARGNRKAAPGAVMQIMTDSRVSWF